MRMTSSMCRFIQPTLYAAICSASLLPQVVFAGAWTGPAGATYNKLGLNYFMSDEGFDGDGELVPADAEFTDTNFTYYGEFGVRDDLSLFTSVLYKSLKSDPVAGESIDNSGFGDIDIGARYNPLRGDWGLLSVQGLIKVPEAYDADDDLPLGNGEYDYELRLLYGHSLWPRPFYISLEGGYRWRDGDPSDEWKYLAELGYTASESWFFRTKLDGTTSAKNADTQERSANPTLSPDYDLAKLELTAGYTMNKNVFLEFTVTPTVSGRDIAAGTTLSAALVFTAQPDD